MEWAPHDEAGVGEGGCAGWSVVTAQAELLRGVRRGEDGIITEEQHCDTGGPVLLANACVHASLPLTHGWWGVRVLCGGDILGPIGCHGAIMKLYGLNTFAAHPLQRCCSNTASPAQHPLDYAHAYPSRREQCDVHDSSRCITMKTHNGTREHDQQRCNECDGQDDGQRTGVIGTIHLQPAVMQRMQQSMRRSGRHAVRWCCNEKGEACSKYAQEYS